MAPPRTWSGVLGAWPGTDKVKGRGVGVGVGPRLWRAAALTRGAWHGQASGMGCWHGMVDLDAGQASRVFASMTHSQRAGTRAHGRMLRGVCANFKDTVWRRHGMGHWKCCARSPLLMFALPRLELT